MTKGNDILTEIEGIRAKLDALGQVKRDVAYVRGFMDAIGNLEGTIAGMSYKLQAIQNSLAGRASAAVRETKKQDEMGWAELGRMPMVDAVEFLKKYRAEKGDGSISSGARRPSASESQGGSVVRQEQGPDSSIEEDQSQGEHQRNRTTKSGGSDHKKSRSR